MAGAITAAAAWRRTPEGVRLTVKVTPRARMAAVGGVVEAAAGRMALVVKVRAAPAVGEANAAVIAVLAATLGVPRMAVRLAAGAASRLKEIDIAGDARELDARLTALAQG
jgi:hypothetical protein